MARECKDCGNTLDRYSPGNLCSSCQERRRDDLLNRIGENPYYDVNDMSFLLGIGTEQVRRNSRDKKIPGRISEIRSHRFNREVVDPWLKSGTRVVTPELQKHYSYLANSTLKFVEILEHYYKSRSCDITPYTSHDFPFTPYILDSQKLTKREFRNLMSHLLGEIPEMDSIVKYPSACKRYFKSKEPGVEIPCATISGPLIRKLKLVAYQKEFSGKCPDCPK